MQFTTEALLLLVGTVNSHDPKPINKKCTAAEQG